MTATIPAPLRAPASPETITRFLLAMPAYLRDRVRAAVRRPGGRGLRAWVGMVEEGTRPMPEMVAAEVVRVYLHDADAEPAGGCGGCDLPLPASAGRTYFTACPHCGGPVGGV